MEKPIERKEDWAMLYSEYIAQILTKRFKVGVRDCCFMPAGAVRKITGFDPASEFRGKVKTKEDADAILEKHNGIAGLFTYCMGFKPHKNKWMAKRGDVVVCDIDGTEIGGVVDDSGRGVFVYVEKQLSTRPLDCIKYVWSY